MGAIIELENVMGFFQGRVMNPGDERADSANWSTHGGRGAEVGDDGVFVAQPPGQILCWLHAARPVFKSEMVRSFFDAEFRLRHHGDGQRSLRLCGGQSEDLHNLEHSREEGFVPSVCRPDRWSRRQGLSISTEGNFWGAWADSRPWAKWAHMQSPNIGRWFHKETFDIAEVSSASWRGWDHWETNNDFSGAHGSRSCAPPNRTEELGNASD